jgi:hypothetical protein
VVGFCRDECATLNTSQRDSLSKLRAGILGKVHPLSPILARVRLERGSKVLGSMEREKKINVDVLGNHS